MESLGQAGLVDTMIPTTTRSAGLAMAAGAGQERRLKTMLAVHAEEEETRSTLPVRSPVDFFGPSEASC
jgi:hypothetical protein